MTETAVQPDSWPTRKLATALVALPLIDSLVVSEAVAEVWPQLVPLTMAGPKMTNLVGLALSALVSWGIAYFVKDRPNIPVNTP
jgi:hypothetical protein